MIYNNGAWKVGEAGGVIRGNFFIPKLKEVLLEKPPHCFTVKVQTSGRFFLLLSCLHQQRRKTDVFQRNRIARSITKKATHPLRKIR